jgi:hypothetical protein
MAGSVEIVMAHGIWQLLVHGRTFVPRQVGVYGATLSGKTTLDQQLTTKGEIRELEEKDRTHHNERKWFRKTIKLPPATVKRVKSNGLEKTIVSRDIGGHIEYHSMWLRDMIERKVGTVVIVVDHRHLQNSKDISNQTALGYLVQSLSEHTVPRGLSLRARLRAKKYTPQRILLIANKADEWMDDESYALWEKGFISRHPIFDVFREDLYKLHSLHIPVQMDAISARYAWNVEEAIIKGFKI